MNSKEEVFGKELQYLLKLTPSSACHSNSFFYTTTSLNKFPLLSIL